MSTRRRGHRRNNTFTSFLEDIVDDSKDFIDDVIDRGKDVSDDVQDVVRDVADDVTDADGDDDRRPRRRRRYEDDEFSNDDLQSLKRAIAGLAAKVDELAEISNAGNGSKAKAAAKS